MKRSFVFTTLCMITIFSCTTVNGDFFTGPDNEDDSQAWRVFGAISSHPGDALLFMVEDYFELQKVTASHVKFKPTHMKSPEWNNASSEDLSDDPISQSPGSTSSQGVITFKRYKKSRPTNCDEDDSDNCDGVEIEYLCTRVKLGFGSEKHLIVISPMVGHTEDQKEQIVIEFEHVPNGNPNEQCEAVVLPSHGGQAHADPVK